MNYFSVTLGVVAGICLGFGILYLFIGLRRKEKKRLNLTFSLFAFAYAGAILAAANNYAATLLTDYISAGRYNGPFVVIAWISLLWYVSFYTKVQPRPLLYLLMIAFIGAGVANTLGPNLIYEDITRITFFTLPWGEQLAIAEVTEGLWFTVFLLAQLVSIGFIFFACFRQYRRGERQAAVALGVGMLWFIVTIVVDSLVDTGTIDFIFLSDFGFLVLAIVLSIQMANEVIKTEEKLADYRQNLETMVETRTAELGVTQKKLLQQTQEEATLEERSRLARDLHDAVTQTIYSAALIAEVLPAVWERDPDQGRLNLAKLRQLVRGALAEMRSLLFELRPAALEHADLGSLLLQQGDALTGRTRIPVTVDVKGQRELPPEVTVAFYRITQEAFNNVEKHARADQVTVILHQSVDEIRLTIQDNGRGFDPASIPAERMGVQFMRERAEGIGATFELKSRPGQGTQVCVTWSELAV